MTAEQKQEIVDKFLKCVKGVFINTDESNERHCGKEGHWLEKQMNIKHNSKNQPDINGFEMKKYSNKITFGDFSASEYLFSKTKHFINSYNNWKSDLVNINKTTFIEFFGTQKNNRYSWSGSCVPTYNVWNTCGQKLIITDSSDICAIYSYAEDTRHDVKEKFPDYLKNGEIIIAVWKNEKMRKHIDSKFNANGFIIMMKEDGVYNKLCFGKRFDYDTFIAGIKNRTIIFDSGMYVGNNRNYSQFRSSSTTFWKDLITEEY